MELRVKDSDSSSFCSMTSPFPFPRQMTSCLRGSSSGEEGSINSQGHQDFIPAVILILLLLLSPKVVLLEYASLLIIHQAGKILSLA